MRDRSNYGAGFRPGAPRTLDRPQGPAPLRGPSPNVYPVPLRPEESAAPRPTSESDRIIGKLPGATRALIGR
jgi:hypothetical protein